VATETLGESILICSHGSVSRPVWNLCPQTAMCYRLEIREEARQQLRALAKEQRRNVGRRLDALQSNLSGDVKKLTAKTHEYRLRVDSLRVLLTLEKDLISVYAVRDRKQAYE
jgi:mRNA-degrading endonuclease RelE of RelBE toxin-antitoxin system